MILSVFQMDFLALAAPLFCAIILSIVLTRAVRDFSIKHGWTCNRPLSRRDIHSRPIPRLGGVAIFATFSLVVLIFGQSVPDGPMFATHLVALLAAGALIFALGLWDDFRGVSVPVKFGVEIVAATILFANGFRIFKLPLLFGSHHFGTAVAFLLTTFWVVLVTNSFNLIDGLDGLASGSALFSLLVLLIASLQTTHFSVSFLAIVLVGATLGFLRFNFSPASIFLGDSGSLLLGFMVSALALAGVSKSVVAIVIPLVSFTLPILDTVLAVLRRFLSGRPLFAPDREHIHHKLLEKGLSQRTAAVVLYCVSAVFGVISLSLMHPTGSTVALASITGVALLAVGVHRLGYYEFAELGLAARRILAQKQAIARNVALRHAVDDLNRATSVAEICQTLTSTCIHSGFEWLQITVESNQEFTSAIEPMVVTAPGLLSFTCSCPDRAAGSESGGPSIPNPTSWMLAFELGAAKHRSRGSVTAYSNISATRAMAFDINLLTNEFRSALGNAIERALLRCERTPSLPAAQASTDYGQQEAAA